LTKARRYDGKYGAAGGDGPLENRLTENQYADCSDGIVISVLRDGSSREFRTAADEATIAKPGYPECVALIVQIGDHLSKQFDVKG
jgi:hypothetical protein